MKAVITAATTNHLRPLTHIKNKHLLELANKPIIFYAIEKVKSAGINEIGIVVKEGVPEFDINGNILRVEERPIKPKSPYAVTGIYFYDANVHKAYPNIQPSFRGSYEIADLHTWLAQNGYNVKWQELKGSLIFLFQIFL